MDSHRHINVLVSIKVIEAFLAHVFSLVRMNQQLETLNALEEIRSRFKVKDIFVSEPTDYDLALKTLWGKEDLIVLEQDIVPSLSNVEELAKCSHSWCACWYTTRYMDDYEPQFKTFNGLGFTKISFEAQRKISPDLWFKEAGGDNWKWSNLDSRLSSALVKRGYSVHTHGEVKHNRVVDWTGKTN